MIGIYKITSPSGRIYIGQSWDIAKRHQDYKYLKCKDLPRLYYSFLKYGYDAHKKEVIIELPSDSTQSVLDNYECFCIEQHIEAGDRMLNIKAGGSRGKHAPESIDKLKAARKKQSAPTLGMTYSIEGRARISAAHKGKPKAPEHIAKLRAGRNAYTITEEDRRKMREGHARNPFWVGRKHREESRQLQSLKKIGNKINNKKVEQISTGKIFDSLTDAAASIGVKMPTLSNRILKGKKRPDFRYV